MNNASDESQVVSELYDNYTEVQKEILSIEIRKTRNKLFTIAVVIFVFDLLAILMADIVTTRSLLLILVLPVLITGLAILSIKEPLIAMIIAALLIVGLWVYTIIILGGKAIVSGWIGKAILVYLLIAGFQNAVEAAKIKRELKL
ncbi:MAG: hypothetical protein ACRDEB_05870 [Chitinophagaceae bacterium]